MPGLDHHFFRQEITALARALIGARLLFNGVGGTIVETEAYAADDPASHSFIGRTERNHSMFEAPGCAYVYRIYGVHWCLNVVGGETAGAAVLIRAVEPTEGVEQMCKRRGIEDVRRLCSGPGKLCQALGVTGEHDGAPLDREPFDLTRGSEKALLVCGPRIGVSRAPSTPWRFGRRGSAFLSRAFA